MSFFSGLAVLDPKGAIGLAERGLMLSAVEFMLIVAVPVYLLLFFFAWKYRASSKKKSVYMPEWEHGAMEELIWWAIPLEIILILGALTWSSTHELDPRKPIQSSVQPLKVQVVSLDWKWLFIYPEEKIATVNYLHLPVGRPVVFSITADAPMNAFWIPQLGGMIYAMTGMTTTLNLIANEAGHYAGSASNYSGDGFAHMRFAVDAISADEFESWVSLMQFDSDSLTAASYELLAEPGTAEPENYGMVEEGLYDAIIRKFTHPAGQHAH